jgi:glycosyltransferase involved in cell wall biosynthesis
VDPRSVAEVRDALLRLLGDAGLRARYGAAGRRRAAAEFSYDQLAARLAPVAAGDLRGLEPLPDGRGR